MGHNGTIVRACRNAIRHPCGIILAAQTQGYEAGMTRRAIFFGMAFAATSLLTHDARAQILHTPHDQCRISPRVPTIRSAADGAWSSPATWTPARLPAPADIVSVSPHRHVRQHDRRRGRHRHRRRRRSAILRSTSRRAFASARCWSCRTAGSRSGTASNPVPASVTAEIIIRDKALNASADPINTARDCCRSTARSRCTVR